VCAPGVGRRVSTGVGLYSLPPGTVELVPPSPYEYPQGTVWVCQCGQGWVSEGAPAAHMPGRCTFRREGRLERRRRERRATRMAETIAKELR